MFAFTVKTDSTTGKKILNLSFISINHALVDMVCAYLLFSVITQNLVVDDQFVYLIIWYGLLAFGLQPLCGLIIDYYQIPYQALALSLGVLLTSILAYFISPWLSITLCALANAIFHVSAGTISFNITPQKASAPGIYVGPGALGLFLGTWLGRHHPEKFCLILIAILVLSIFVLYLIPPIKIDYQIKKISRNNTFWLVLLGLLLVVGFRSIVGMSLVFAWKSEFILAVLLVIFVVIGKMLAGLVADRFGWLKTCFIGLILSIPLLYLGADIPYLAFFGALSYQVTMPVTLTAVALLWPGRPGWAFGLPCGALILGALITFFDVDKTLTTYIPLVIIIQIVIIIFSLNYFYKLTKNNHG